MKVLMLANGKSIHSTRPLGWLLDAGCEVVFVDEHDPFPAGRSGYRFVALPPGDLRAQTALLRDLGTTERPDVTHVHWMDNRVFRCMEADLHPLVLSLWGSDINQHFLPQATQSMRDLAGRTLSGCDLVVIDSHDMPAKCRALAGREVPTVFLHLGVDTRIFAPGPSSAAANWSGILGIPVGAKVLLSPRAWSSHYNHHFILEAFAAGRPGFRKPAVLVFKVYNATYRESLVYLGQVKRFAEILGVSDAVRWIDAVPKESMPGLYAVSDVVLNYPSQDTLGVTLLEAAACQCPVITCRLPSYEGTFVERFSVMTPMGDLRALSKAMQAVVNTDTARNSDGLVAARKEVVAQYDSRIYVDGLLNAYRRQIAAKTGKEFAVA